MAQEEIYGTRDRSYSAWHRRNSTRRFVGIENAQLLHMIDMDAALYVEFDDHDKSPLALIETALDRGQPWKTATVTRNLAELAGIPAFVVLYKLSETRRNEADPDWFDIDSFRVKRLRPNPTFGWKLITPQQWADSLVGIRKREAANLDLIWNSNSSVATNQQTMV